MKLSGMQNLGSVAEVKLQEVGIDTPEKLREIGAEGAFLQVRDLLDEGACLHFLYALEGAIRSQPKKELPANRKRALKEFYQKVAN